MMALSPRKLLTQMRNQQRSWLRFYPPKLLTLCVLAGFLGFMRQSLKGEMRQQAPPTTTPILHTKTTKPKVKSATAVETILAWMAWAPEPGSAVYESMREHFAGALPDVMVGERVKRVLQPYGLNKRNTIYAESIAADEISHGDRQLTSLLTQHWGNVFTLGGLGGFPHGGPLALSAFAGHVPHNGNLFIFYGPHVGISESGQVGCTVRLGLKQSTTACGSLTAAYENCLSGLRADDYSAADSQARLVQQELCPYVDEIQKSKNPEATLPRIAYDVIHRHVEEMTADLHIGSGSIVLLGGIMISTPLSVSDQFLPLHFSIKKSGHKPKDLLDTLDISFVREILMKPRV
eukprot:TRINITY_DN33058_c0_g1_i1.p1 TRINITY_DN33058_c0_g1~~TRINITY_DN33058_c0_g1_i1.p1  ORF type:complete len:348 (+),score=57.75 TRINITY_DN33058_c0_g1_i1:82-1125(+)